MITLNRFAKGGRKRLDRTILRLRQKLSGGGSALHCNACDHAVVGFYRYGDTAAFGCPLCDASPRERFVNAALDAGLLAPPAGARLLQIAPSEASLVARFRKTGDLVTGDLHPELYVAAGAVAVDLMDFAGLGAFDVIYASHVMEHVPDDAQVLRNMHAQLNPGGEAWLIVPLHDAPTVDGTPDMSPQERERQFGQWDHVRQYGPDFADRLRDAGFEVRIVTLGDLPPAARARHALNPDDRIFVARR